MKLAWQVIQAFNEYAQLADSHADSEGSWGSSVMGYCACGPESKAGR